MTMKNHPSSYGVLRYIAVAEWILILPAVLFMTALFVRDIQPPPYEPAQTARRLVDWFAVHPVLCLDTFLIALPFAVFVVGCITASRRWKSDAELRQAAWETLGAIRAHLATLLIAGATLAAAGILGIVALHVITD
jgi:hypothetical protein